MRTINRKLFNLIFPIVLFWGCSLSPERSEFHYKNLVERGGWEIVKVDSTNSSGMIKLKKEIWLMNFLHWRKLSNKNENISVKYVKHLMNSLWGMQFTLTGTEGTTTINGHPAYYVDGKLKEIVKTRFIVWNCPESGRQFISDCNINIARNTPERLFNLQTDEIANTICCHGSKTHGKNKNLPQFVEYENENVSFDLPDNWRSNRFIVNPNSDKDKPGHYPDGMTKYRGTVWNLLSDSEKEITFVWNVSSNNISYNRFERALHEYYSDTTTTESNDVKYISYYSNIKFLKMKKQDRHLEFSGAYDIITEKEDGNPIDTTHYTYKAFNWQLNGTEYLLSASVVAYNNVWGIPVDLAPTGAQLNEFINGEVLSTVTNNPVMNSR